MASANLPPGAMPVGNNALDPFLAPSTPSNSDSQRQRYAAFDSNAFSTFATDSPRQAKHALEAYIAETQRRLEETSKIGNRLVAQRSELNERLKELQLLSEDELSPALKSQLLDLERDFNDVTRETARVFTSKSRVASGDGPEREATEFGGVAHASPTKAQAVSRKQRNQPANRTNDLKLATEISSSLLEQVRALQATLTEKDMYLRELADEKARLEGDLLAMQQKLRVMDENEQRFKDENWSLESQIQELNVLHKEAVDREQRLNVTLKATSSQKATLERELEDVKQSHAKLADDHVTTRKQLEDELTTYKKNADADITQITGLHKKVEELTSQNKELAQAFAYRMEGSRTVSAESALSAEDFEDGDEAPEDSPPGSPSKATPRHGALHDETTRGQLNHAYRTIQNLKNTLHREKSEKLEFRRINEELRRELETVRKNGADSNKKRKSTKDQDLFKKPSRPDRLGEARASKEEIIMDEDEDWEDHDPADTPSKSRNAVLSGDSNKRQSVIESSTDAYATATEHSEAFETANERDLTATESEAFLTGAETLDGDSDLTETEAGPSRPAASKRPNHAHRHSFQSTASTSADEYEDASLKTPVQPQAKFKVKLARGGQRRISARPENEAALGASRSFEDSPAPTVSSNNSTPAGHGMSLAAELDGLSDDESERATPASSRFGPSVVTSPAAAQSTPAPSRLRDSIVVDERPQAVMVSAGTMTDPWEPEPKSVLSGSVDAAKAVVAGAAGYVVGKGTSTQSSDEMLETVTPIVAEPESSLPDTAGVDRQAETAPAVTDAIDQSLLHPGLTTSSLTAQDAEPISPATPALTDFPQPPVHKSPEAVLETAADTKSSDMSSVAQIHEPADPATSSSATRSLPRGAVPVPDSAPEQASVAALPAQPTQLPQPIPIKLSRSTIIHQETEPVDPPRPSTASKIAEATGIGAGAGFLGGLLGRKKTTEPTKIAEDETSLPPRSSTKSVSIGTSTDRMPLRPIEPNAPPSPERRATKAESTLPKLLAVQTSSESTQTALSSEDMDRLLRPKIVAADSSPSKGASSPIKPVFTTTASPRRSREFVVPEKSARRPSSAGSSRSKERSPPPPLPVNSKQAIAAAAAGMDVPPSSASSAVPAPTGLMGPPTMPASAYRNNAQTRPRTPQMSAVSINQSPMRGMGPSVAGRTSTASRSQVVASPTLTRRTSQSSFASELDHRFNISAPGPYDTMYNDGNNTDPRMIQAITQTMIGEYLYKYTRKAGSSEFSNTRHKRFFWIHPFTRTLYWSDYDPTTTGKDQMKSKSVQIEAIRIVSDDNVDPPGLHRKSLVIITPGRLIKFTAPTSQRHETWSNALTYLLLKPTAEKEPETEDIQEFNPSWGLRSSSRATGRSRASISSYMSRSTTVRTGSPQRQHPSLRTSTPQGQRSHSVAGRGASISNRLSAIAGSFSSRHSKQSIAMSAEYIDPTTETARDSAEDLRQVIERQEREADRLENVRACCDGQHNVASLSRNGRHGRKASTKGHVHTHGHTHNHSVSGKDNAAAVTARSTSRTGERTPAA